MITKFLSLLDAIIKGMSGMLHYPFSPASPLPKPRALDRIMAAFVLLSPVWIVIVIIMAFVEKASTEDRQRVESSARIESFQDADTDPRNEAYGLRFLTLFDFDDYRTVRRGFPAQRNQQVRVDPDKRAEALGMSRFDLEAVRAGKRPVSAQEMISLCEYRKMALSDCLNLDYPLTFAQRKDLGGVSVARWLENQGQTDKENESRLEERKEDEI